jgi:membrane protease YdiL (CAAX protease family)
VVGAFTWTDGAYAALAFFLVIVGLALAWALLALAGTFTRMSEFLHGTQEELVPVIGKVGGSVDRVNLQLDKVDQVTDSAVDAVDAIDKTVRTVSFSIRRPVELITGLAAGLTYGFATLRARRDLQAAIESGKEAAARRQSDLRDELRHHPRT